MSITLSFPSLKVASPPTGLLQGLTQISHHQNHHILQLQLPRSENDQVLPPTFVRVARPNPPTPVAIPSKLAPYIQSGDVRCGLDESNKMCCTFPQNFTIPDKLTALSNDFKQKIGKPVQPPHSLTHPKSSSNSQLTPPPSLPPLTSKPIN